MIDIETLDILPQAAVLSIGVVYIDHDLNMSDELYIKLDIDEQLGLGSNYFTYNLDTLAWWDSQPAHVRDNTFGGTTSIADACKQMYMFFKKRPKAMYVARGNDFDFPIIDNLFRQSGRGGKPWKFYHQMDYRTMCNFFPPEFYNLPEENDAQHDALSDAKYQARGMIKMLKTLPFLGIQKR